MARVIDRFIVEFGFRSNFQALNQMESRLSGLKRRLNAFGTAAIGAGTALTGLGAAPVLAHSDFESTMAKIEGLVGISKDVLLGWRDEINEISVEMGRKPQELVRALYFITSAGLRGRVAMEALRETARGAAGGLGEQENIAFTVASAINAYGAENLSAAEAMDHMTEAVRLGTMPPHKLAHAMGVVLPMSSALGVEFGHITGLLAALSRTGTSTEEAVTQLNAVMNMIIRPSDEARVTLDNVGLSLDGLRNTIRGEQGLFKVLMTLKTAFGDNIEEMGKVFPNIRALRGVFDLLGPNFVGNKDLLDQMNDSLGVTQEAFEAAEDTVKHQFLVGLSALNVLLVQLGEDISPVTRKILDFGKANLQAFMQAPEALRKTLSNLILAGPALVATGVAAKLLTLAFDGLRSVRTMFAAMLGWLNPARLVAALARVRLAAALMWIALAGPALVFIGAGALAVMGQWEAVKAFFQGLADGVRENFAAMESAMTRLGDAAGPVADAIMASFRSVSETWDGLVSADEARSVGYGWGRRIIESAASVTERLAEAVEGWEDLAGMAAAQGDLSWSWLTARLGDDPFAIVKREFGDLKIWLSERATFGWGWLTESLSGLSFDPVRRFFGSFLDGIRSDVPEIRARLSSLRDGLRPLGDQIAGILDGAKKAWQSFAALFEGGAGAGFADYVAQTLRTVVSLTETAVRAWNNMASALAAPVSMTWDWLAANVPDLAASGWQGIHDFFSAFFETVNEGSESARRSWAALGEAVAPLAAQMTGALDGVIAAWRKFVSLFNREGEEGAEGLGRTAAAAALWALSALADALAAVLNLWTSFYEALSAGMPDMEAFGAWMEGFAAGLSEGAPEIARAWDDLAEAGGRLWTSLDGVFRSLGAAWGKLMETLGFGEGGDPEGAGALWATVMVSAITAVIDALTVLIDTFAFFLDLWQSGMDMIAGRDPAAMTEAEIAKRAEAESKAFARERTNWWRGAGTGDTLGEFLEGRRPNEAARMGEALADYWHTYRVELDRISGLGGENLPSNLSRDQIPAWTEMRKDFIDHMLSDGANPLGPYAKWVIGNPVATATPQERYGSEFNRSLREDSLLDFIGQWFGRSRKERAEDDQRERNRHRNQESLERIRQLNDESDRRLILDSLRNLDLSSLQGPFRPGPVVPAPAAVPAAPATANNAFSITFGQGAITIKTEGGDAASIASELQLALSQKMRTLAEEMDSKVQA